MGDQPDAAALVGAVRTFLLDDVTPAVDGQLGFHCRVAANVLALVAREIANAAAADERYAAALAELGVEDEPGLAKLIASPDTDPVTLNRVDSLVRRRVWERVLIANPRYLEPYDDPLTARETP